MAAKPSPIPAADSGPSVAKTAVPTTDTVLRAEPVRRRPNPYSRPERPPVPLLLTVREAAETLRTTPEGLRARLRRAQVADDDGTVTAPLGPGIVGIKVGAGTWRVRFDAT